MLMMVSEIRLLDRRSSCICRELLMLIDTRFLEDTATTYRWIHHQHRVEFALGRHGVLLMLRLLRFEVVPSLQGRRRCHHTVVLLLLFLDIRLPCNCRTFASSLFNYILLELLACDTGALLRDNGGPPPQTLVMINDGVPRAQYSVLPHANHALMRMRRQLLVGSLRRPKILTASAPFRPRSRIVLMLLQLLQIRQGGEIAHTGRFLDFIGATVRRLIILEMEGGHRIMLIDGLMLWVLMLLGCGSLLLLLLGLMVKL